MISNKQNMRLPSVGRIGKYVILAFTEFALITACVLADTNPPPALHISLSGPPGAQTPELFWDAQPGAVYTIESRTSLGPDSGWVAIEPVSVSSNQARWKAPELNASS